MKRFVVVHLLLVALATVVWFPPALAVDDAFITFRYAENLAAGEGFRYNATESILDARPLFTALLAVIARIGGGSAIDAAVILQFVSVLALSFACVVIFWRRPCGAVAALVPWLVLSDRYTYDTTGMESLAFLAAAAWAIAAAVRERWAAAGLLTVATTLIRPDGIFLAAALLTYGWQARTRLPVRYLTVAGVAGLAWCAFATARFGSPLPPTIAAKAAQAKSGIWPVLYRETLWTEWIPNGPWWLYGLAAIGAGFAIARRDRLGLLLLAWLVLHQGAYAIVNVPAYPWYHVPLLAEIALLAAFAVERVAAAIPWGAVDRKRRIAAVATTLVAGVWLGATSERLQGAPARLDAAALAPRHVYRTIGNWLKDNAKPTDCLGAFEVGMVGYYSGLPIADFFGLVTPDVALRVADQRHVDHVMRTYRPTFLLGWDPPTGHDSNMPQYVTRGYDVVMRTGQRVLYRRRPLTEQSLAERVARLGRGQSARATFGDFPKMLDFDRFRAHLAKLRPDVDIVRWPTGAESWAIRLDRDGRVSLREIRPPLAVGGGAVADWHRSGNVRRRDPSRPGVARFRVRTPFAFIHAPVSPGPGPFRRVRLRINVLECGGRQGAAGRVWWSIRGNDGPSPLSWTTFSIPDVGAPQDVIVHFPGDGIAPHEVLDLLRIDLLDQPGLIEVHGVWLDRA